MLFAVLHVSACGSGGGTSSTKPPADAGPDAESEAGHPHDGGESDSASETGGPHDIGIPACDSGSAAAAPRPIAPLSTATVTSQRPTLHWELAAGTDGAKVDICRDRACTTLVTSFTATGQSGAPASALTAGVYFWRVSGLTETPGCESVGSATSPVWEFWVGAKSAPVDSSWGSTVDVNGDGFPDVVVGAPYAGGSDAGGMHVYLGSSKGLSTTPTTIGGPTGGTFGGYLFGDSVASAGDVDGDGFGDVIVGLPDDNMSYGSVYLYRGSETGLVSPPTIIDCQEVVYDGGESLSAAGDVNGDGYADVVFGASGELDQAGYAYVYFGGPMGLSPVPTSLTDSVVGGGFGARLASIGDVNGDGFADLAIGSVGANMAYVYMGSSSGLSTAPIPLTGGGESAYFGEVAAAGDVNGDGYADLAVGALGANAVYVYLGGSTGLAVPPATLTGPIANSYFGDAVACAGDVNGDGLADLVVGAYNGATPSAYVYLGDTSGISASPLPPLTAPLGVGIFGEGVGSAGDVNNTGLSSFLVTGVLNEDVDGVAYLYSWTKAAGIGTTPVALTVASDSNPILLAASTP